MQFIGEKTDVNSEMMGAFLGGNLMPQFKDIVWKLESAFAIMGDNKWIYF